MHGTVHYAHKEYAAGGLAKGYVALHGHTVQTTIGPNSNTENGLGAKYASTVL